MTTNDQFPRTWSAILRNVSERAGLNYFGIRADQGSIYLQLDGTSLTVSGEYEQSEDIEAVVHDLIEGALK